MLVVDLICEQGHRFEGWFGSADDLAAQQSKGLVTCPVCGDAHVRRVPSAVHVVTHGGQAAAHHLERPVGGASGALVPTGPAGGVKGVGSQPEPQSSGHDTPDPALVQQLQALWLHTVREIVSKTEDVGERFPDEVRAIHHGDAPERALRGQATPEERQALRDEGIEVIALPLPDAAKGPLH